MTAFADVFATPAKTWYVLARDIEYAGTAVVYGGLAFLTLLWPTGATSRGARRLLLAGWAAGAGATLAALGLEGAWAAQRPPASAWDRAVLSAVLATDFGRQWLVMALLWLLALVVIAHILRHGEAAVRSLAWRVAAVAVGFASIRVFGLTGHSPETTDPVLAQVADLVHLAAISVWFGGLAMLLAGLLPRRQAEELDLVVPRYSRVATACASIVVLSGTVLAWRIVGTVSAVTGTAYGHTLLVKLALLATVLAAGYGSKIWVEHRLDFAVIRRSDTARGALLRPFVASVATETALLVLVLTVASALVTADPSR